MTARIDGPADDGVVTQVDISVLVDLEADFARRVDKAWKPFQVFRSDAEVAADEARHDVWIDAHELVKRALDAARKAP